MARELTEHRCGVGINQKLRVVSHGNPGPGGAYQNYEIYCPGEIEVRIPFQWDRPDRGVNGLTDEALLAILIDRLSGFQHGPAPCAENQSALNAIRSALDALQRRERRMTHETEHDQTVGGTRDARPLPELRVARDSDGSVVVDGRTFTQDDLNTWKAWNQVESAVKAMDPPITAAELAVLKETPTTRSGRNGLREFLSALGENPKTGF